MTILSFLKFVLTFILFLLWALSQIHCAHLASFELMNLSCLTLILHQIFFIGVANHFHEALVFGSDFNIFNYIPTCLCSISGLKKILIVFVLFASPFVGCIVSCADCHITGQSVVLGACLVCLCC